MHRPASNIKRKEKEKSKKTRMNLSLRPSKPASSSTSSLSVESVNMSQSKFHIPALYTTPQQELLPSYHEPVTKSSYDEDATVTSCLAHLKAEDQPKVMYSRYGVQKLLREKHIEMLYDMLEDFPKTFVTLDSSRPWMMYWAMNSLAMLGEDLSHFRERYVGDQWQCGGIHELLLTMI